MPLSVAVLTRTQHGTTKYSKKICTNVCANKNKMWKQEASARTIWVWVGQIAANATYHAE
jgi:hypothetical protein